MKKGSKLLLKCRTLHSSFRFRIIGKRFYTRLLFFKLNSFIWPCSPYIFNSLHQITLAESYFKLDFENFQHDFWIFVQASVIVDQDHLSGGWSWVALQSIMLCAFCTNMAAAFALTSCCTRNFGGFRFLSGRWLERNFASIGVFKKSCYYKLWAFTRFYRGWNRIHHYMFIQR